MSSNDPLAALKAEARHKREQATSLFGGKKWKSRAELERDGAALREKEAATRRDAGRQSSLAVSDKAAGESGGPDSARSVEGLLEDGVPLPPLHDVTRTLRRLREPITMFGEDERARVKRMRALELERDLSHGGQENAFRRMGKDARAIGPLVTDDYDLSYVAQALQEQEAEGVAEATAAATATVTATADGTAGPGEVDAQGLSKDEHAPTPTEPRDAGMLAEVAKVAGESVGAAAGVSPKREQDDVRNRKHGRDGPPVLGGEGGPDEDDVVGLTALATSAFDAASAANFGGGCELPRVYADEKEALASIAAKIKGRDTKGHEKAEYILARLKAYMHMWEGDLDHLPDTVKKSPAGMRAMNQYRQCLDYIKPFFRILKERSCPDDIIDPVFRICRHVEKREYVKASDIYFRLAIGNAPWPMGVTMVGIHERSGREKIFTSQVAHILNDEMQRKYIQSLKRIMTYAQEKFPSDPSRCV